MKIVQLWSTCFNSLPASINDDRSFPGKVLLSRGEVLMRDDGWETPCLQLRHNTKHQPDTDTDEIQIQIDILRNMNKLKRLRFLTIKQHLKDLSELSVDQFERVLWQIQVSERIDEILSSIDINLTPARYRVKDFDGSKWRKKRNLELSWMFSSRKSFHSDIDQRWGIWSSIGNREKCENSGRRRHLSLTAGSDPVWESEFTRLR